MKHKASISVIMGLLISLAYGNVPSGMPTIGDIVQPGSSSVPSSTGGNFGQLVQKRTADGMKTFKDVSYQKFSGDKEAFFESDSSEDTLSEKQKQFKIKPSTAQDDWGW